MRRVTATPKRIDAPDGSGWIEIKALGWLALDNARTKRLHQLAEIAKLVQGLPLPEPDKDKPPTPDDPLVSYDKLYLLKHGLVAWSEGDLDVEQLDEPTADWAAREILAYSVPGATEMGKSSSHITATVATPIGTPPSMNGS